MLKDRLHDARMRAGLTLDEVARRVGVSRQTIHRYETGIINNIPSDNIEKIASVLGTTPADLMGWEANETQNEVPMNLSLKAGTPEYTLMRAYLRHQPLVREEMAHRAEMIDSIFSKNVSRLLKESGDINGFMQSTGLSFDTVGKFMQGETVFTSPDESERIAKFFNSNIIDMFFGEPKYSPSLYSENSLTNRRNLSSKTAKTAEIQSISKLFDRQYKVIPENTLLRDFLEALEKYAKTESTPSYEKTREAFRYMRQLGFYKWFERFISDIEKEDKKRYKKEDALYFLAGELYKSPALFQMEFRKNAYAVHNYMALKHLNDN